MQDKIHLLLILLLLMKHYSLCKVLACSATFFQLSLSCATFFQLRTFILFISSKTSSSQCVLGLPIGLLDMGFHLLIFWTLLSSAMCSRWPNQFNLCFLTHWHIQTAVRWPDSRGRFLHSQLSDGLSHRCLFF